MKSRFVHVFITIIVTALVVGGGVYVWQNQSRVGSVDLTTYNHLGGDFSFQYPSSWTISSESLDHVVVGDFGVDVTSLGSSPTSVWEWAEKQNWPMEGNVRDVFEETTVAGLSALRDPITQTVYVLHTNKVYALQNGIGMERGLIDVVIYDAILDSFVLYSADSNDSPTVLFEDAQYGLRFSTSEVCAKFLLVEKGTPIEGDAILYSVQAVGGDWYSYQLVADFEYDSVINPTVGAPPKVLLTLNSGMILVRWNPVEIQPELAEADCGPDKIQVEKLAL
jgi:hypothetical protein